MDIIGIAFIFGFMVWLWERHQKQRLFGDRACRECGERIRWRAHRWEHMDGHQWHPPSQLDGFIQYRQWANRMIYEGDFTTPRPHMAFPGHPPTVEEID